MGELLNIGDFSSRCGLSVKMLRSYAATGLLTPAAVDASSGYRYYSTNQVHRARIIALLRQAGVAVHEIAAFFARPDVAQLDRWEREILRGSTSRQRALARARALWTRDHARPHLEPCPVRKGAEVPYSLVSGTASHRGTRDQNQDTTVASDGLLAVADGIGGLANGERAGRLALGTLDAPFASDRRIVGLLAACHEANEVLWREGTSASRDDSMTDVTTGAAPTAGSTMGTTLAALAITSDMGAVSVHVGDSRLYRLRNGGLVQLTQDHTVVADLLSRGELSYDAAATHPHRHVLTRAIGVAPMIDVDYAGVSLASGDRLLLCTDGLCKGPGIRRPEEGAGVEVRAVVPRRGADRGCAGTWC